jgi:hypothetical protein
VVARAARRLAANETESLGDLTHDDRADAKPSRTSRADGDSPIEDVAATLRRDLKVPVEDEPVDGKRLCRRSRERLGVVRRGPRWLGLRQRALPLLAALA